MMSNQKKSQSGDESVVHFLKELASPLMEPSITEIAINRPEQIWTLSNKGWQCYENPKITAEWVQFLGTAVATFSHQGWNRDKPLLSASMPGGERVQFVMSPAVQLDMTSLTLRKSSNGSMTLSDFSASGAFKHVSSKYISEMNNDATLNKMLKSGNLEEFFNLAVISKKNIVVSGATGSGKTTFMKALVNSIPHSERIITIEDVHELVIPHKNVVNMLYSKSGQGATQTTARDLLESSLRMKPDRILLAELRGEECLYFIRAAASGHPGCITSCHAGSTKMAFEQLAIMIQDSPTGRALSFENIKRLLFLTIDIVVQFSYENGERYINDIYFNANSKSSIL